MAILAISGLGLSGCAFNSDNNAVSLNSDEPNNAFVYMKPQLAHCKTEPICTRLGFEWSEKTPLKSTFIVEVAGLHTQIKGTTLTLDGEKFELTELLPDSQLIYQKYDHLRMNKHVTHQGFTTSLDLSKQLGDAKASSITVVTENGTFTNIIKGGFGERSEAYDGTWSMLHEVDKYNVSLISDFD